MKNLEAYQVNNQEALKPASTAAFSTKQLKEIDEITKRELVTKVLIDFMLFQFPMYTENLSPTAALYDKLKYAYHSILFIFISAFVL